VTLEQILSWSALALAVAAAVWRGRQPERLGAAVAASAWLLSFLVFRKESWFVPQYGVMAVDGSALIAFLVMAFAYDRYWLICISAFQALAFLSHFIFLIDPHALYRAYYYANFGFGYLMLGSLIGGVIIEGRAPMHRRSPAKKSIESAGAA
jgi:hypothetical protein